MLEVGSADNNNGGSRSDDDSTAMGKLTAAQVHTKLRL